MSAAWWEERCDYLGLSQSTRDSYLDVLASEIRDFRGEATGIVNGAWWHVLWTHDAMLESHAVIVLTEGRSLVDDTGTILVCDVRVRYDSERSVLKLSNENN